MKRILQLNRFLPRNFYDPELLTFRFSDTPGFSFCFFTSRCKPVRSINASFFSLVLDECRISEILTLNSQLVRNFAYYFSPSAHPSQLCAFSFMWQRVNKVLYSSYSKQEVFASKIFIREFVLNRYVSRVCKDARTFSPQKKKKMPNLWDVICEAVYCYILAKKIFPGE